MFRQAAVSRPRSRPASNEYTIPPPVGGLNARDAISDMPESDALILDNFFPQPDYVEIRRGYSSHATGLGSAVESVMEWAGPSSRKFFGAAGANIYEVTSSGAVGAADVSSLSNARWQHVMQATAGGKFLICVNGADSMRSYDGSSWDTPTITGVSSADLINVFLFKERLFFIEDGTLSAWYLDTKAISGAATELPLGSVFKKGGYLLAAGSLTRDGGAGPDDIAAFITTTGEVAIYQGTDPTSLTTWGIVGLFEIPPPIGKRCLQKAGGDLSVITEGGVISLNAMLVLDRAAQQKAAITSKINRLFTNASRNYRGNFGWDVKSYPRSNMFVVNIPVTENGVQHQYVMNALTGAWCRFTGLNGNCFSLYNEDLYFGGNSGTVWKADTGYTDNAGGITADMKTAFSYLGSRGAVKLAKMVRTHYTSNGSPGIQMDLNVDFGDADPTSTPTAGTTVTSAWDSAVWDVDLWGSGDTQHRDWLGATGLGTAFAVRLRVVTNGANFTANSFDIISERGGMV